MAHDIHISLHEYQYQYMDEEGYNLSKVIRQEIDGRMMEDGADPEEWRDVFGE